MSKRSFFTLMSIFLLLAAFGVFANTPGVLSWTFWKHNTGNVVSSVAVSSGGNYIVAGTENGDLFLFDKEETLIWSKSLGNEVVSVSISGDGNRILVGVAEYSTGEPDVFVFDKNGDTVWGKDLVTDYDRPCGVSISPDGNHIATGDTGSNVRFFDSSGIQLWENELGDWATCVSVSSTGDYIASGSWDDNVYLFDKAGGQLWSYDTEYSVYGVSISPEGEYVASVGSKVFFFDRDGNQLWNITSYFGDGISVSADGNYVAVGEKYGEEMTLFNKTEEEIWSWTVGSGVNSVDVTSDGKFVVGGAEDGFVYFIENLQPTSITCVVSEPKILLGEEVDVSGSIDPPIEGAEVTLTFTKPNNTTMTLNTITTAGGVYNQSYTPDTIGFWTAQASWPGDTQYMGAESPTISFSVGESTITCGVSNWQIYLGTPITVSGTIDPPHAGVDVTLTYAGPGDTVVNRTVTSISGGNYSDTTQPNLDGMWNVWASWLGDADTMGAESAKVRFLVSTVTEVTIKIGQNQTFSKGFQPPRDYYYSPAFEDLVWDKSVTPPAGINFTTLEGTFYYESMSGLGGTITSFEVTYNIEVLDGTSEGIYEVTAYYDISSQSTMWPYSITFLFTYELRCEVNAAVKYDTSINLSIPPEVKLGEEAPVSGTIIPAGGSPVAGVNVTLSYTKPNGSAVNRTVVTGIDGSFQDAHVPDMPGKWTVQASWNGDEDRNGTESVQVEFIVLSDLMNEVTWNMGVYFVRTLSNSTVSNFVFNGSAIQMSFDVSGLPDTLGFCNVTIPKSLLRDNPWTITIDGMPMTAFVQTENESHTFLYLTYVHTSTLRVIIQGTWIVSEFTSAVVLPLFLVFSLLTVVMMKLKKKKLTPQSCRARSTELHL